MRHLDKRQFKLLQDIASLFEANDIVYWIESGTLLGIVRDGTFLPAHPDIDIAIHATSQEQLLSLSRKLWFRYRIKPMGNLSGRSWVEGPYTRFILLRAWEHSVKAAVRVIITVKYKHENQYRWIDYRSCKHVDASYYDKLDRITFRGNEYPIPRDIKTYLCHRYGEWKTVNALYQSRIDDRSIADTRIIRTVPGSSFQKSRSKRKPKKIQLTGKYLVRMKKMLFETLDIFDTNGISYWLDDGSLLGIIRDGTLIPWDHDVDIGIPGESVKHILDLKYDFLPKYLLRKKTINSTWLPGQVRSIKIKTTWEKMMHVNFHVDLFAKYKVGNRYHWIDSNALKSIDAKYYDQLDEIEWEGRRISIPSSIEDYLTIRYNDWRTPSRNFSPSRDDGAVAEKGF